MKKETIVGILLAILAIAALGVFAGYLTWQYRDQILPVSDEGVESEADAVLQALRETSAETETSEDTQETENAPENSEDTAVADKPSTGSAASVPAPAVIWVGDSRTLGMQKAVANSDVYIGAAGEGYDWFVETGLDELRAALEAHPESVIVFNFGVNDYDNLENYMELYGSLLEEYADRHFYFLSVNPIDPEQCQNITNEEIADFNDHLRRLSPDAYLDSYTLIKAAEIQTIDGIHYSQDDYRFIYDYAVKQIVKIEQARADDSGT